MIESKSSALYRCDDGGVTWEARDNSQKMVWRPFYFARLVVDPTNPNRLFKPDLGLIVSEDGGKSFSDTGGGSHGDWHDLWIDPTEPQARDRRRRRRPVDLATTAATGGGRRTTCRSRSSITSASTTRTRTTCTAASRTTARGSATRAYPGGITNAALGEPVRRRRLLGVPRSDRPERRLLRVAGRLHRARRPQDAGVARHPAEGRLQREAALQLEHADRAVSPTQKGTIYLGSQFLFRSRDRGDTWERISPDLTTERSGRSRSRSSRAASPSTTRRPRCTRRSTRSASRRRTRALIWVGTDDGNVQLTRDGGKTLDERGRQRDRPADERRG